MTAIEKAKALLERNGYTVLRTKSYNAARERLRVANAMVRYANEDRERGWAWARREGEEWRRLEARCTFLYGEAIARGATSEDLKGPA